MATLYKLQDTFKELLDLMQSGEIDEEVFQVQIDSLDLEKDIDEKIESYVIVMDELKASSDRINNEIKRLRERKKSYDKNLKKMKETLLDHMKLTERDKVKTDRYTVWYQNNPESLVVNDEENIPKRFYKEQKPKLDRRALLDELKATDGEIDGVEIRQTEGVRYR